LEKIGILPLYIEKILALAGQSRSEPSDNLAREVELICSILKRQWRERTDPEANVHVFIGPPGSGKTTCLCKWLAKAALLENRRARVWRLDCAGPNAAESLSVYAEILGVPVERFRPDNFTLDPSELLFIDLPGMNWREAGAIETLVKEMGDLPAGHVHLVLNAAYEVPVMLQQVRAYSKCMIFDLILTHLDEEPRWGKLWNLILGTNYSIGWLSAGQNIPGDFHPATAQLLFDRQFIHK
jgi:flagellar biosynthesis protein FlhF